MVVELPILTDVNVVEGIVASVMFPLLIYITRRYNFGIILSSSVSWFITWVFRKASVNIYEKYKTDNKLNVKYYNLTLPSWMV